MRKDQELRDAFKQLTADWKELDRLYQKEASKKKVRDVPLMVILADLG